MLSKIRGLFGRLIGAQASEIGLVHCTKAGEQIVLDSLPALRSGGNVVTNDLHFSGSLHNLIGLKKAGLDVRIVRSRNWDVSLQAMQEAIDERTALVSVSLLSNINGRVEPIQELSEAAHAQGAYVFADIIQAAGIVPFDVRSLGIDFAACSGYKWLFGPHGAGFFYVRQELQGSGLPDHLFPGHVRPNYAPWVESPQADLPDFAYAAPDDASRYQPGHVSYLGYSALYEGLKFIERLGVERSLQHSIGLNRRLKDRLDPDRYQCISPHPQQSPIITFIARDPSQLQGRLSSARVVVSLSGNRIRVSPAVFNNPSDIDRLAEVLSQT
ncbi:MAG: aminotransferase class V-fold PLP-dependent enzyme [Acidobacteriota bacterium]